MSTETPEDFDREAVRAKYLEERDKRLVPGRADIVDVHSDRFAPYLADPFTEMTERDPVVEDLEVVIVGGGIAGMLVGVQLRKAGIDDFRIVDQAGGIGGTWYWNQYPGLMCDVESYIYIPMLEEMGIVPTQRYATGAEILADLRAISARFELERDALFHTGVTSATWDEEAARWDIETDRGDRLRARYYVLAVGILNLLKIPDLPGLEDFAGTAFHTSRWDYGYTGGGPHEPLHKMAGRKVALIGTGATGIQIVMPLARAAEQVYVVMRTPSAIGVRDNRPTDPGFADSLTPGWQMARADNFEAMMMGRPVEVDLVDDAWTHDFATATNPPRDPDLSPRERAARHEELDFEIMERHRRRVEETVEDPATADALKPWYRYRCKRPCFHDEFLASFNEPNVELLACPSGIERITERGLVIDGVEHEVDCIIFGSGFESEFTPIYRRAGHPIAGRGGVTLADRWADGAHSLYGMMSRGFPNMFIMPAPGQQAVITVNYTHLATLGAHFVGRTITEHRRAGVTVFDVSEVAEKEWGDTIVDTWVDASAFLASCTPSRLNNEGRPEDMNPRNGNYGGGRGDFFAFRDLLNAWLDCGASEGLELESRGTG